MSWGERESRHRPFIFLLVSCCSSNVFVRWFHLHRSGSRAHLQIRAAVFYNLLIVLASDHPRLYLFASGCKVTFKSKSSAYFHLVSEGEAYPFPVVPHMIWDRLFFVIIFNYHSHSIMTGWPKTSPLGWVTQRSSGRSCTFYACFFFACFLISLVPQKLASCSLYSLDQPYHVTQGYISSGRGECSFLVIFVYCVLVTRTFAESKKYLMRFFFIFKCFRTSGGISSRPVAFLLLIALGIHF